MFPRINGVRHIKDFVLELAFTDGTVSTLDFRNRIVSRGGVFSELENVDTFRQVAIDSEAGTIAWPNGVDFCPDVLYAEATGRDLGICQAKSSRTEFLVVNAWVVRGHRNAQAGGIPVPGAVEPRRIRGGSAMIFPATTP
jgi:hypothetical protein